MENVMEKDNLAGKIRAYMAEHPNAKAPEVVANTGATLAYVYSVAQKARKSKAKAKPTKGQTVVRAVLNKDAELIENMKTLLIVQQNRIEQLTTIVTYLETVCFKDGASV
jgi:hypothetical protein